MLYWLLSLLAHTSNLHAIWIYAFLFLMYISMLYIYIYIKIVSIHAGMNWERNPVDAIQENQDRWMSKTSIGSPTGPSGSTDRKAGRLLKRLPDRCSDAVVGAADGSSVFFLSGSHCFKWLWIHPWYGMCMYSWLYQVGVSLCYPRTFRLTGPLSYCANASQKCVLTAPNAAISTLVAEQGPYLVPWLWGVVKRKHPGKRIVEINSLIL